MRPRITYANAVSSLALFIALGGTGYAAVKLPAHSVGSRELRDHSVTPRKLAKTAQPLSRAKLRSEITQVVSDPATGLNITLHAQDGAQGAKGDAGGAGPQGTPGPTGPRGESLGYGHAYYGGSWDEAGTSSNVKVFRGDASLSDGVYHFCVDLAGADGHNIVATVDANDPVGPDTAAPISTRVKPTSGACAGHGFEVLTTRSFYFIVN